MRTLYIDIETSPIVGDVWSLWQQNVGLNQIHEVTRMLCFAAKWEGEKKTYFLSEWTEGTEAMVGAAHALLEEADVVVHYNGNSFDVKHLNREFKEQGLAPPAPFKSVDVLNTIKQRFKLPSNKLQYVSTWLGLEGKVQHSGHSLWRGVIDGDAKARATMAKYNKQDVVLLEKVVAELGPWMIGVPNQNLYGGNGCPLCGADALQKRGFSYTLGGQYQRYQCMSCKAWSKDTSRIEGTKIVSTK